MRSFDIDLRGFSTILQTPGARAPGRLDAAVIRGGPIEAVLPAHYGVTFGSVTPPVRYGSEPWQLLIGATTPKLDGDFKRGLRPGL